MDRTPVTSSNISAIGYDPQTRVLEVEFTTGAIYQYTEVSETAAQALLSAESIGRHFNAFVRAEYACTRIL